MHIALLTCFIHHSLLGYQTLFIYCSLLHSQTTKTTQGPEHGPRSHVIILRKGV